MGFETSLNIGVSALRAAQKQMEVTAHNIANVGTEGYSRQRVELEPSRPSPGVFGARGDGMMGTGVTVADVIRMRNTLSDAALRAEAGGSGAADARAEVLARAETVLGPVDEGVPAALSKFFTAWDDLSLNANDSGARLATVDAGTSLTAQLRSASGEIDRLMQDTGLSIGDTVAEINVLARKAAELNQAVAEAMAGGHSPNDLQDARDVVLDKLARLTGGIVRAGDLGSADVYVSNRALVRGREVEVMKANVGSPAGATWAADNKPITSGGRLGALTDLVNTTLPALRADLDAIALGLRDTVNAQHQLGFDQDGNPGIAFFTGTSAADIGVNALMTGRKVSASQSGAAVDAANALAMAGLRKTPAVGTDTLQQALHGFAGKLGSMSSTAKSTADAMRSVVDNVKNERDEFSSVSLNEELADMVRFQHAYEAAAKVIQVVDQMLDHLINTVGR